MNTGALQEPLVPDQLAAELAQIWINWLDRQLLASGRPSLELELREALQHLWFAAGQGSIARPISPALQARFQASGLLNIGLPGLVVMNGGHLYLPRWWQIESELVRLVKARLAQSGFAAHQPILTDPGLDTEQSALVSSGLRNPLTFLTGGPGTGKTRTLVALLQVAAGIFGSERIAVAAPTGKAASRLNEGLASAGLNLKASTVQRLLGFGSHHSSQLQELSAAPKRAAYGEKLPLPFRLVVIDEASMLGLELAQALFAACNLNSHLVLAGDRDQLASVEPGNVFAQLVDALGAIRLKTNYRQANALTLAKWAHEVREGQFGAQQAWDSVHVPADPQAWIVKISQGHESLWRAMISVAKNSIDLPTLEQEAALYDWSTLLTRFKTLCGPRTGPLGVETLNQITHQSFVRLCSQQGVIHHFPELVIVRRNLPSLGLANGDIGVAFNQFEQPVVMFNKGTSFQFVQRASLPVLELAWALTVHQAQGSEFNEVLLILPPAESPITTRELAYTAMTRARDTLWISGSLPQWQSAVQRPTRRDGQLATRLLSES